MYFNLIKYREEKLCYFFKLIYRITLCRSPTKLRKKIFIGIFHFFIFFDDFS